MDAADGRTSDVLAGTRVLDFGRYIAGPYCAALLADLGADVIRVERRGGGEDRWVAPVGTDGVGALYLVMNRNKRAMTLDPACPEGREIVQRLVATADVVVANLPPEVLRSLALDLESLRRVKSDIILTTVTAFGGGGPWSHKHGFDGIGQVMCGSAYLTGTPEQPTRAAVAWVDCGTASLAAFGTLAALMARSKTGRGQKVEGALLRTAIAFNNSTLVEQQVIRANRVATLNRGQTSAPSDLFRTKDGWIIAYAIGAPMFARWAELMGEDHWLTDPRFKDDEARGKHAELVSKRMAGWTAERTTAEALAELELARIPGGPALLASASVGRYPHPRGGPPRGHGVSRAEPTRPAGSDTGRPLRHAGTLPTPSAHARRAHGCDPRRTRLPPRGDRGPTRQWSDLASRA